MLNSTGRWLGISLDANPFIPPFGPRSHHGLEMPIVPRESRQRTSGPLRWEARCFREESSTLAGAPKSAIQSLAWLVREAVAFQSPRCPAQAALSSETWDATQKNGESNYS